jgi:hypothetical protein
MTESPQFSEIDDAPPLLLPGIMLAVAAFAVIVAGGVYGRTGKVLALPVVLGTAGAFLLIWSAALRRRTSGGHAQPRRADQREAGTASSSSKSPTAIRLIGIILLALGIAGTEGGIILALRTGRLWDPLAYLLFLPMVAAGAAMLIGSERWLKK